MEAVFIEGTNREKLFTIRTSDGFDLEELPTVKPGTCVPETCVPNWSFRLLFWGMVFQSSFFFFRLTAYVHVICAKVHSYRPEICASIAYTLNNLAKYEFGRPSIGRPVWKTKLGDMAYLVYRALRLVLVEMSRGQITNVAHKIVGIISLCLYV